MPFTTYMEKALLDWSLQGATPTRPPGMWVQWATGTPNDNGASDGPFSPRQTVTFAAGNSPQGSATNAAAMTGTATAAATAVGWNLYDSNVGGTRLFYGTLAAAVGCKSADNPCFSAGALKISIS